MALCATSCAVDVPVFPNAGCEIETRKSGIQYLGLIKCDYVFSDITDPTEWATAVAANQVHITTEGIGAKPETTKVSQKLSSCRPEQKVGETHTVTFRTYGVDTAANTDYAIHNTAKNNLGAYRLFWVGCDGLFYVHPDYASESAGFQVSENKWDYIMNEDSNEPAFYDIEVSFDYIGIVGGVALPGVLDDLA